MTDKKLRELMDKLKTFCEVCIKDQVCSHDCPYAGLSSTCQKPKNNDMLLIIEELQKHLDMKPSVEMNLSVADQAREEALISAYKTISKVLDGSKNGPELLSAIPIADGAARIAKAIEENRNMKTTADVMLTLGQIVDQATKNVPEPNGGVGTIIGK